MRSAPHLIDLNTADYYADGCHANSYFIVPVEGSTDSMSPIEQLTMADINAILAISVPSTANHNTVDIWESESAKADNEVAA